MGHQGPAPARPRVHDRGDPAALRGDAGDLVLRLERPVSGRPPLHLVRQLRRGAHRPGPAQVRPDDDPADRDGRHREPGRRTRPRAAPRPEVPRPRPRAHAPHRAVPAGSRRRRAAVEARPVQPRVRAPQRPAALRRRPSARLDLQHPAARRRDGPGVAVDALHDADPARGPPVALPRTHRGGPDGRRGRLAGLPVSDAAPPAPLPRAGRPARLGVHRAELRRRLHDHLGRPRHRQPAVHRLPELLPGPRERPRVGHAASWSSSARSSSRRSRCAWCRRCSARRRPAHESPSTACERARARRLAHAASCSSCPSPGWC